MKRENAEQEIMEMIEEYSQIYEKKKYKQIFSTKDECKEAIINVLYRMEEFR